MVQMILQLAKTLLIAYGTAKAIKIISEKVGCDEGFVKETLKKYGMI